MLLSHGWTDGLIPANNTVKFYGELLKVTPKVVAAKQVRLFMVPGMDHCGGGDGASSYDTLGTIDAWAAGGGAPERIIATRGGPRPTAALAPALPVPADRELQGRWRQGRCCELQLQGSALRPGAVPLESSSQT